jgi:hypothetical protein
MFTLQVEVEDRYAVCSSVNPHMTTFDGRYIDYPLTLTDNGM